jgi:hypothetical protein
MNRLHGRRYIPVIRTREAELKGIGNVTSQRMDLLLPVVEFTRSRRSKSNPTGAISKSVDKIAEIMGDRPYIADLTSMSGQTSGEVSSLLDPSDGFKNWTDFVANSLPRNTIPSIHLTEPFEFSEFVLQLRRLWQTNGGIAIRVPVHYPHLQELAASILPASSGGPVVVLADAAYVRPGQVDAAVQNCSAVINAFAGKFHMAAAVSSSFPSSVTLPEYGGGDAYGKFSLAEVEISERLKKVSGANVPLVHGDYALVHPLDFEGTVTNWVPRVDVPLDRSVYYHRVRRPQGGYVQAASNALVDNDYVPLDCWGEQNILEAAAGNPLGRSPSHWIAVRVNFQISRQAERLR